MSETRDAAGELQVTFSPLQNCQFSQAQTNCQFGDDANRCQSNGLTCATLTNPANAEPPADIWLQRPLLRRRETRAGGIVAPLDAYTSCKFLAWPLPQRSGPGPICTQSNAGGGAQGGSAKDMMSLQRSGPGEFEMVRSAAYSTNGCEPAPPAPAPLKLSHSEFQEAWGPAMGGTWAYRNYTCSYRLRRKGM